MIEFKKMKNQLFKNMRFLEVILLNSVEVSCKWVLKVGMYKELINRPGSKVVIIGISPPNVVLLKLRKFLI